MLFAYLIIFELILEAGAVNYLLEKNKYVGFYLKTLFRDVITLRD